MTFVPEASKPVDLYDMKVDDVFVEDGYPEYWHITRIDGRNYFAVNPADPLKEEQLWYYAEGHGSMAFNQLYKMGHVEGATL